MKKVLILITKSNWGGAQRHVFDLATRLPKNEYDVYVMSGGNGPLISKLRTAGIRANGELPLGRDIKISGDFSAFIRLCSILRHERPDILHLHSSKIGGLGALAGRLCGIKNIVFTIHGWAFNEERPFAQRLVIKFSYWIMLMLAHQAIAVSQHAKNQVRHWPFVGKKMRVVHHGITSPPLYSRTNARLELANRYPRLKEIINAADGDRNTFWVGTIAELHHIKGYRYAIEAFADCVNELKANSNKYPIYLIAGEGDERASLENQIVTLDMQDHIILLGHVDNAYELMSAFDVFMLASLSEGLGYVLLESGLAQSAVVATTAGGIPEIIDDMESGVLVQPKSSRELSHALLFMIEHPRDRKKYTDNLKRKIQQQFSLEMMVEKTIGVYEHTIADR